jgi:hypothetical protein
VQNTKLKGWAQKLAKHEIERLSAKAAETKFGNGLSRSSTSKKDGKYVSSPQFSMALSATDGTAIWSILSFITA